MALPISYIIGLLFGMFVFACIVGGIIAMLYFLYFHLKKVVNNIPDNMKGGTENNESKNKESGGEEGRGGERKPRESKRRWWRRRKRNTEDPTNENNDGFEHRVQVQPTLPFPEVERQPDSTNKNPKRDWPSFS